MGSRDANVYRSDAVTASSGLHSRQQDVDPLDNALISGGDQRLAIDSESGLNGYGCQPSPRLQEISFSSSTASTISQRAYLAAATAYRELLRPMSVIGDEDAVECLAAAIRAQLKSLLGLHTTGVEVVLSPSGTDSELHAHFLARQMLRKPVTSIIVAADETGSGVPLAAAGRHYARPCASGSAIVKGETVRGLGADASAILINARDAAGAPRTITDIDLDVQRATADVIAAGGNAVLHVMDHSKLGTRAPSLGCLEGLWARSGDAIRVVVDACQGRLSLARLRRYLDAGFMVILTGSKFFTGPPLSGALLVPAHMQPPLTVGREALAGLSDYTARHDWPERWTSVRNGLPRRSNIGQILRWTAALEEMQAYFAVPPLFRNVAMSEFAAAVPRMLADHACLEPLPQPAWFDDAEADDEEFGQRSIFPFLVMRHGQPLTLAQSRTLYAALNRDLSQIVGTSSADMAIAAKICHVGQPVGIRGAGAHALGAIRVSAGARLISQSWSSGHDGSSVDALRSKIAELRLVFEKIELIVSRLDGAVADSVLLPAEVPSTGVDDKAS
jgi:hypothetical protein